MQPKEAFKIGFMARCVEMGMSPEDTGQLMKQANTIFVKEGFEAVTKPLTQGLKTFGLPLMGAAAVAPWALGGGAAYLANQATDVDATDIEEVKKKELIETYKRMADQMKRQRALRDRKKERKRSNQVFL